MQLKIITRKGALEIQPVGKLDLEHAESFETKFMEKIKDAPEKTVGISLSRIDFIDSSGLGALIKVLNQTKNLSKHLILFGATPKIQNVFSIARLEKFFTFQSTTEFNSKFPTDEDEEMNSLLK